MISNKQIKQNKKSKKCIRVTAKSMILVFLSVIFSVIFLVSSLAFVSAQSVSVKLVEEVQYNIFNINNPSFKNGPNSHSPSGVPIFSSTPQPVPYVVYATNIIYDQVMDIPNLPNDQFADFLVGEGVFANPRISESNLVNENYEHLVSGFVNYAIQWENNSLRYYFYEFADEDLATNILMDELLRRLEHDSDFLTNYFNLDYSSSHESKASEMIRRKFWEHFGIYDYESRCTVLGSSGSRKGFFDYYLCTPNVVFKGDEPTVSYVNWRTRISTDEDLQNIIRLTYYDSLLDEALLNTHPNIRSYSPLIDSESDVCSRLKKADEVSKNVESNFLSIDQIRGVLGSFPYDSYERLRVGVFYWFYLNNEACRDVSLAGVMEEGKGQVGKTLYGIRNYAFNLKDITAFELLISKDKGVGIPRNEDVLAKARINYKDYDSTNADPFSRVFTNLVKVNYPFETQKIPSLIYSSNFHNESFTFFTDARIKSLEDGVVTIQDKYFDPVVFSSQAEFLSKNIDDVRSISFVLENFKDAGAAIRSGKSSTKDLTGCLLFLGKDYCNGFIDIDYSSSLSLLGEYQKVLNVRSGEVFDLDYYRAQSGIVPLLVDVHASPENPVKVLFEGKEIIVAGNTQFDMSSLTSVSGMDSALLNGNHKLGELNIRVNSGSVEIFDTNKKVVEFGAGSDVAMYSMMESRGDGWVNAGDAGTLNLRSGNMKSFNPDGSVSASLSSDEEIFVSLGQSQKVENRCKSLKVKDCASMVVPELAGNSRDIVDLLNDKNFDKDFNLNFISFKDDKVTTYFSGFNGELRTSSHPLTELIVYGDVVNNGVLGFVDGWDILRGGERLVFSGADVIVNDLDDALGDNVFLIISKPDTVLFGDKHITLNQDAFEALSDLISGN